MRYLRRITYSLLTVYCACTVMLFTLLSGGGVLLSAAVCAVAVIIPSMLLILAVLTLAKKSFEGKEMGS